MVKSGKPGLKTGKVWLVQPGLHPGKPWFNRAFGTRVMYKVLQYELNCKFSYRLFNQEKRRLFGSFSPQTKTDVFLKLQDPKTFHIQNSVITSL